jgi:hypothetical protein
MGHDGKTKPNQNNAALMFWRIPKQKSPNASESHDHLSDFFFPDIASVQKEER